MKFVLVHRSSTNIVWGYTRLLYNVLGGGAIWCQFHPQTKPIFMKLRVGRMIWRHTIPSFCLFSSFGLHRLLDAVLRHINLVVVRPVSTERYIIWQ